MRRHDAVRVRGRRRVGLRRPAARAAGVAAVDERVVVVGRAAVRVHPDRVDAVRLVAALGDVRRREAPRAVARRAQPVVDLRVDRQRVVLAPGAGSPVLLGHEQRRHQRLEHRAAPARRQPRALVLVAAVEDVHAGVVAVEARRARLLPVTVAGVGEAAPAPVVGLARQLALRRPDVVRDPALRDDGVVAAHALAGRRHVVEQDLVARRLVVEAEVHRVVQRAGACREARHAAADDLQAGREPAVVDRREDRRQRRAGRRPGLELRAGAVVVPVVVLAGRLVALHPLERRDRPLEPADELGAADEAEPLGGDRAPHVRADVGRRRLHLAAAVAVDDVGREPALAVGHRVERGPCGLGVALERRALAGVRRRGAQQHDARERGSPCLPHRSGAYPGTRRVIRHMRG